MDKPLWHYTPRKNWMNDPNGLCQIDGTYHMFYQHNPHGDQWGDIHWGHATSKDLMHWEEQAVAMGPAVSLGEAHCYSGSCCKDREGVPHFFYTSVGDAADGRDARHGAQQWRAEAVDAALTALRQTDENAVTIEHHPGMQVLEWRDPCVLSYRDQYLMVTGGCVNDRGAILLYTSADLVRWTYRHILAQSDAADGVTWECPNLIEVDGLYVLVYSPCGRIMARVGDLDERLQFHTQSEAVLDPAGFQGYYAPQCFKDESGKAVIIGWMPECDSRRKGWSGMMSLPRVMHVRGGKLYLSPLPGIERMATQALAVDTAAGDALVARSAAAMVRFSFDKASLPLRLSFLSSPDGRERSQLLLTENGVLQCDRSASSLLPGAEKSTIERAVELTDRDNAWWMAIDSSAVEVMVNGQWLSARVYPTLSESVDIRIQANGAIHVNVFR